MGVRRVTHHLTDEVIDGGKGGGMIVTRKGTFGKVRLEMSEEVKRAGRVIHEAIET